MPVKTYNPKRVILNVATQRISGFGDQDMVNVQLDEDLFSKFIGVDGTISRTQNPSTTGFFEITLAKTSPSNTVLSGLAQADRASGDGSGAFPVALRDELSEGTTFVGVNCWVTAMPDSAFAKEINSNVWKIDAEEIIWMITGTGDSLVSKLLNEFSDVLD